MTVEGINYQGVFEKPPVPFSLKTLRCAEDFRGDKISEAETIAGMIEQIHPERSAYATIRGMIDVNRRHIRPNRFILEDDPFVLVGIQNVVPGVQNGEVFVVRTFKAPEEAPVLPAERNRREFTWLINEMPDLYTYHYALSLEDLREMVRLSQDDIDSIIQEQLPKALNALDSDGEFSKWAGPNWKDKGIEHIGAIGNVHDKKRKVSWFGTTPNKGPALFLTITESSGERIMLQKGNPQSKTEAGKQSVIVYRDSDGKIWRDKIGAHERILGFIERLFPRP